MGGMDIDVGLGFAKTILGISLFVIIFQLLIHCTKGIYWVYQKVFESKEGKEVIEETDISVESSNLEAKSHSSFCALYVVPFFSFVLVMLYLGLIVVAVISKYSVFEQSNLFEIEHYLASLKHLLAAQFLAICIACLLWSYATHKMRRLIPLGLFVISVDVVIEVVSQYFQYPFYHWMQLAELLLSGLALLIIPSTGFLIFKYLYKLQRV